MPAGDIPGQRVRKRLKMRKLILDEKISRGGCKECGYNGRALHWHHRNPAEKKFLIGSATGRSFNEVRLELKKCDLLCANCHYEMEYPDEC